MRHHPVRKHFLMALVGILTLGLMTTGCNHRNPAKRADHMVNRISSKLDLNESQKTNLNVFKAEALADFQDGKQQRLAMFDEVQKQLTSGQVDPEKIKLLHQEHQKKMNALFEKWLYKLADFQKSLSPEQRQLAVKHLQEMREHFEE